MSFSIEVESGKQVKLPTAGKYCDRDIVVSGTGYTEADLQAKYNEGKQAEYDAFWDVFQNNGDAIGLNYYYKFANDGVWTDENFNPKYDLVCNNTATAAQQLFRFNTKITDTKKPIKVRGSSAQAAFYNCSSLVTIRKLIVHSGVDLTSTFFNCTALENIEFEGEIGKDVDLSPAYNLSRASIESTMAALSSTVTGKSVSFYKAAVNKAFTDAEWATLANTRSNWTINLV